MRRKACRLLIRSPFNLARNCQSKASLPSCASGSCPHIGNLDVCVHNDLLVLVARRVWGRWPTGSRRLRRIPLAVQTARCPCAPSTAWRRRSRGSRAPWRRRSRRHQTPPRAPQQVGSVDSRRTGEREVISSCQARSYYPEDKYSLRGLRRSSGLSAQQLCGVDIRLC